MIDLLLRRDRRPVIAGMATIPSRLQTLPAVLHSIVPQVSRLYLYLDGHDSVPDEARGDSRIVPLLSSDFPNLRANGKFLPLWLEQTDFLFAGVDDDIAYPPDYVASLRAGLRKQKDHAIVGYHGVILPRPLVRYALGRTVFHFADSLTKPCLVDILGTGTIMFAATRLRFDVRTWPHVNMMDLYLALEGARAKLPLVCLAREEHFLYPLDENQPDSCYVAMQANDAVETELARLVIGGHWSHRT